MYVSGEISKHKHSLYLSTRDLIIKISHRFTAYLESKKHILVPLFKYTLRSFVLFITCRILFIALREYFQVHGCLICTQIKETTEDYLVTASATLIEKIEKGEIIYYTTERFHKFVDWISDMHDLRPTEL